MARYEFPTSFEQRRMWVLDELDPGGVTYNVPWAVWLDGPLDAAALAGAWAACVARHEALRTLLGVRGGVPVQLVDDEAGAADLPVLAVDGENDDDQEQRARQLLREFSSTPFDLAAGPLIRAVLLRLAPGRHVLSVVAQHIVADGWSLRLLLRELAADYEALRAGEPVLSPEPDLQYADFALWQADHDAAGGYADAEAFWRAELDGAPAALALPADHPCTGTEDDAAEIAAVDVDARVAAGLRALAADRKVTLFAVVAAGYAALLARLAGVDDLVMAVPVAARLRAETERVVGLFANTLVIRADLHGDPTLAELASRLHAANGRAQPHQELPFARLVEVIGPERQLGRSPLVQVMCSVEETFPVQRGGGLTWRPELVDNGTGKFELDLLVVERPDSPAGVAGLDTRLRYRSDLFDQQTATWLAGGLSMMLAAMAAAPGTRLSEVDILPARERELVTRCWPAGQHGADRYGADRHGADRHGADRHGPGQPLPAAPDLVAQLARACTGDRVVIRGGDGEFTGAQLGDRARAVAAALTRLGAGLQDTVGILLPRGARPLAALLGAWWIGAAYLPIDPDQPPERIRGMLADAGIAVLISDRAALGPLLAEIDTGALVLDLDRPLPAAAPAAPLLVPPDGVGYMLFTSGSTGRPKAVAVTFGSLAYLLLAFGEMLRLEPSDRVAAVTAFGFDIAILELLLPLLAGAQAIVADADQARDGTLLRRMVTAAGATVLQGTPATWRMLADAGGVPERVRLRLSGGDALPRSLADAITGGADTRLWNLYGPTETTVYCTGTPVTPGTAPLDVGTATTGSTIYVLDRWGNPVPPGVAGEVYLGGVCVARGYVGAPGLTARRFVPDPFSGDPGARLYRSGDLGKWRRSGRLEILGRLDRQLKVRGFRVETAEIEAALRSHPEVANAVVTAVTGAGAWDVRLVAYLVTGLPDPATTLREYLPGLLPGYMIPWAFVPLPELPLTQRGKVDYRALPQPSLSGQADGPAVAPRTPLESELAGLMAAVLRLPGPVGTLDSFFVLGGHSLTATQLMARIWSSYEVDLPVRTLFDDPTVAGLAAAVTAARTQQGAGHRDGMPRHGAQRDDSAAVDDLRLS